MPGRERVGIVLGGGGARGAYQVGVVLGLHEVLRAHERALNFDVLVGNSIGALNAVWLAAHAHESGMGIGGLRDLWTRLSFDESVRFDWSRLRLRSVPTAFSLLDPRPLDRLLRESVPWTQLQYNLASGVISSLVVTALNIATGSTTAFVQHGPGESYVASTSDPRRSALHVRIRSDHVLASAAFPWLFPAREIDGAFYCDGGLRFNTPLAPALRAGSTKLVVISLLSQSRRSERTDEQPNTSRERERLAAFPSPVFLLGKLLNALLLDPIEYDLSVLERVNRLMGVLEEQLDPEEMERVRDVLMQSRGAPYRRVPALTFLPSKDVSELAAEFLESQGPRSLAWRTLRAMRRVSRTWEADLMSFVLVDGAFARELIELGRRDVHARAPEVLEFFGEDQSKLGVPAS